MFLCDIHKRQLRVCEQRDTYLWACASHRHDCKQNPKWKVLSAKDSWLLLSMATRHTKALGGIQEEHIFLKFPGGKEKDFEENMKTYRRRLPCIAADILRMTKLEWSRLLHRCCHSVVMTISCQFRRSRRAIFGKIFFSAAWNCTDRKDTTTEGEDRLNRSKKKKKTWWCRLYYYHCCKKFLSKSSSENSSSSSRRLELRSFWSAEW